MRRLHRPSRRQSIGAGAVPFTPADVAGLEAWYRETYAAGTWTDLSGNGRSLTQATADNRPTQVERAGQLALSFDGSNDFVRVTFGSPLAQPLTIYTVHEATAIAGVTRVVFDSVDVTNRVRGLTSSSTSRIINAGTALSGSTPTINMEAWAAVFNGGSSALYASSDFVTAALSGAAGANTMGGLTVAADITGGNPLVGYVWELLIYSGTHNAATRKLIGDYLTARYGGLTVTT